MNWLWGLKHAYYMQTVRSHRNARAFNQAIAKELLAQ